MPDWLASPDAQPTSELNAANNCARAGAPGARGNKAGWSRWPARLAHNQEVAGSNPAPATSNHMDRRSFLKFIPGMIAAAAAMPDELLWTPTKTYFIPDTVKVATWDEINEITLRHIIPRLVDNVFKESPLLAYMKSNRKLIRVGPDGVKLSDFDLSGGSIVEEKVLDEAGWPLVENPLAIAPDLDERQDGHGPDKKTGSGYYRQRGFEVDRQQAMHRISQSSMRARSAERPKGLVFPMSRFRPSYS